MVRCLQPVTLVSRYATAILLVGSSSLPRKPPAVPRALWSYGVKRAPYFRNILKHPDRELQSSSLGSKSRVCLTTPLSILKLEAQAILQRQAILLTKMAIWLEGHNENCCCRNCELIGVSHATCPQCFECVYCKRKGHLVADCPKSKPCQQCHKKGHAPNRCRQKKELVPMTGRTKSTYKPRTQMKTQATFNISVASPRHDQEEWHALPEIIRDV